MDNLIAFALVAVAALAALFVVFIPTMIAAVRGHRSTLAIGLVCLFFGWTVVGWLVALIWSFSDTGRYR